MMMMPNNPSYQQSPMPSQPQQPQQQQGYYQMGHPQQSQPYGMPNSSNPMMQGPVSTGVMQPQTAPSVTVPSAPPSKPRYPSGDTSHIPPEDRPIYDAFQSLAARCRSQCPAQSVRLLEDAEKRLVLLSDRLNNSAFVSEECLRMLRQMAQAMLSGDYATAFAIQGDLYNVSYEDWVARP